jgi:recombination protein RecT
MANEHIRTALTVKTFSADIARYQPLIQKLLPRHFPAERMVNLAVTALMVNQRLRECSMISIVNSVAIASQLGLEPNTSLGHGWLIPYGKVCQFQPGYRGLIHLALQSPRVHNIGAQVVYEADKFRITYGSHGELFHEPNIDAANAGQLGEWLGAYCLVQYKEGIASYQFMPAADIMRRRASSQAVRQEKKDSPWFQWPEEMWRKTAVKNHLKYEELSPLVARATGYDDQADSGKMQDVVIDNVDYSVIDEEMNPEAQVDPAMEKARREAQAGSSAPGAAGLKDRLAKGSKPATGAPAATGEIPTFGTAETPVDWPEGFDGAKLKWNGAPYRFDEARGNYVKE